MAVQLFAIPSQCYSPLLRRNDSPKRLKSFRCHSAATLFFAIPRNALASLWISKLCPRAAPPICSSQFHRVSIRGFAFPSPLNSMPSPAIRCRCVKAFSSGRRWRRSRRMRCPSADFSCPCNANPSLAFPLPFFAPQSTAVLRHSSAVLF